MRLITHLACGVALIVLVGCEGVTGPKVLSTTSSRDAPAPVGPAVLELTHLTVTVWPSINGAFYEPRFRITGVSGAGAVIKTMTVLAPGQGPSVTDEFCWGDPIRVEPGTTVTTFDTGWLSSNYCDASVFSETRPSSLTLTVGFVDDLGGAGTVTATVEP